jgi:hypothetical protein
MEYTEVPVIDLPPEEIDAQGFVCIISEMQTLQDRANMLRDMDDIQDVMVFTANSVDCCDHYRNIINGDIDKHTTRLYHDEIVQSTHEMFEVCHTVSAFIYRTFLDSYVQIMGPERPDESMDDGPPQNQELDTLIQELTLHRDAAEQTQEATATEFAIQMRILRKCEELYGICRDAALDCAREHLPMTFSPVDPYDALRYLTYAKQTGDNILNVIIPRFNAFRAAPAAPAAPAQ